MDLGLNFFGGPIITTLEAQFFFLPQTNIYHYKGFQ